MNNDEARELWEKLVSLFERKTASSLRRLKQKFLHCHQQDDEPFMEFYERMRSLAYQLNELDEVIDDADVMSALFTGVADKFYPVVDNLENDDNMNLERAVERIRDFEQKLMNRSRRSLKSRSRSEDTFYVNTDVKKELCRNFARGHCRFGDKCRFQHAATRASNEGKPRNQDKVKCYNCNKHGHYARDCRKPDKRKDQQKYNRHGKDSQASHLYEDYDSLFVTYDEKDTNDSNDTVSTATEDKDNDWLIDSGASRHMVKSNTNLLNRRPLDPPIKLHLADRTTVHTLNEIGDMKIKTGEHTYLHLKDVAHAPMLRNNLISTPSLDRTGHTIYQQAGRMKISKDKKVIAEGKLRGKLFYLKQYRNMKSPDNANVVTEDANLWHRRLGHQPLSCMETIEENVIGMKLKPGDKLDGVCEACMEGRACRKRIPKKSRNPAKKTGERIFSDLQGPMEVTARGGQRYLITFIDEYTHMVYPYFLTKKSDALDAWKSFRARMNNQGIKIQKFRTDNGGEYISNLFAEDLKKHGIIPEHTDAYSPHQNGVAERMNRTLAEMARCLLKDAGLPLEFWVEAFRHAVYIRIRSSTRVLQGMTPMEALTGEKPDISHIRLFGCLAHVFIPKEKRKKLDSKTEVCILTGMGSATGRNYEFWCPRSERIFTSSNVTFDESKNYKHNMAKEQVGARTDFDGHDYKHDDPDYTDDTNDDSEPDSETKQNETEPNTEADPEWSPRQTETKPKRRSSRLAKQQKRPKEQRSQKMESQSEYEDLDDFISSEEDYNSDDDYVEYVNAIMDYASVTIEDEPNSYEEAMDSEEAPHWNKAMKEEISALKKHGVWTLIDLPKNRKAIKCRWVFKKKLAADGTIERYKARLVAKGFSQVSGIDYNETFAPVAKYKSIRIVLALAAQLDLDLHQMDVKTAFLNGTITEEIYMQQPEGFVTAAYQDKVCKINRGLYGLKQSPRQWNQDLNKTLLEMGFTRCKADPCLYIRIKDQKTTIIAVYVDDIIIASDDPEDRKKIQACLEDNYEITDLGELHWCLQMRVTRNRRAKTITLDQALLTKTILKKFAMNQSKPLTTPSHIGIKLSKTMCPKNRQEELDMANVPYRSAVGSLMYLALSTRPDIATAVNAVSRFVANPGRKHWQAVKHILRYLRGTEEQGITFSRPRPKQSPKKPEEQDRDQRPLLIGYADSDWGGNLDDRRSTTGYVFQLAGGPISWKSKVQPTVALSSSEAEYMAAGSATQEALWLRTILMELNFPQEGPTPIYEDNQGCIAMTLTNGGHHSRTKHIDIKHHFIRNCVEDQTVILVWISTKQMIADILTKALPLKTFAYLRGLLMG